VAPARLGVRAVVKKRGGADGVVAETAADGVDRVLDGTLPRVAAACRAGFLAFDVEWELVGPARAGVRPVDLVQLLHGDTEQPDPVPDVDGIEQGARDGGDTGREVGGLG
jgi:hypothetical protein